MTVVLEPQVDRVPMSRSQQNMYNGAVQASDPGLYLIGKSFCFHPTELAEFMCALEAAVAANPVQLCVLEAGVQHDQHPDLVQRLQFGDIVSIAADDEGLTARTADAVVSQWSADLKARPLVRYTVRTGADGRVRGLDIHAHHLLLDGGAIGVIEADLGRYLSSVKEVEVSRVTGALIRIATAHSRETAKADESLQRFGAAIQRELTDAARRFVPGQHWDGAAAGAARGVLLESVTVSGKAFDAITALAEREQVPLNILVAAAAVAVDASLRQSTQTLLIHAVDNRFGEPDLEVATCLVNSIAHPVSFPAFASVREVVRSLDRDYVKASRRRWLREEQYRRMYLAINKTAQVEALTFNFIRETCAPALRPFLSAAPRVTDIGPVEGMTVSCVADEDRRTLTLSIWHRSDLPKASAHPWVAERIAAALSSMEAMWHMPIAMTVNEWFGIGADGARRRGDDHAPPESTAPPAWFVDSEDAVAEFLQGRRFVEPWIGWLIAAGVSPGDIVVCADDDSDKAIDLLIACHLAGCGYSVCENSEGLVARSESIAMQGDDITTHAVDIAVTIPTELDASMRGRVAERREQVAKDGALAEKTAYIMATSGSTGQPKLVPISHGALALFVGAAGDAYGWCAQDRILQCAPLTSDISVEEVFVAASRGAQVIRSAAMKSADLSALVHDIREVGPTLLDLPTAVWHLLCEEAESLAVIGACGVRQVVVGGEAIRPGAVDQWVKSTDKNGISLISTYGPTETTVVVTHLSIAAGDGVDRLRMGVPVVPNTVFVAFGEVVIVGGTVSAGYLGTPSESFGAVCTGDGKWRPAFATADRVVFDEDGFPSFAGRRDAVVKISGKRIDTAAIIARVAEDRAVADVDVAVHNGALVVWFQTRHGVDDNESAVGIRRLLVELGVSSFFVVAVSSIPRKPNGKVDKDGLRALPQFVEAVPDETKAGELAAGLARIWSELLGRRIGAESSLLAEGIGSLDLIRILPASRRHLGRELSVLDLISADSAAYLAAAGAAVDELARRDIADVAADLERMTHPRAFAALCGNASGAVDDGPIVVLGASGIVGTGFARAALELKREGTLRPDVVLVTRSPLPDDGPWPSLTGVGGVGVLHAGPEFVPGAVDELIRVTGARTLVNCIGNTNVLAPYRDIRDANVEWVAAVTRACTSGGVRLIHMSTFVVNADAAAAQVTDPREAVYPYAASKALAELIVTAAPGELDFTLMRLPRVLGEAGQLSRSADILVSIVDACIALHAFPSVTLTEEVTTGASAARAILRVAAAPSPLGRGVNVVRGMPVSYTDFLSGFGIEGLELREWKRLLDRSAWAKRNPRRWSVIDAWAGLGMRLGSRTYADYLAGHRTIPLETAPVAELFADPVSIRDLFIQGCSR